MGLKRLVGRETILLDCLLDHRPLGLGPPPLLHRRHAVELQRASATWFRCLQYVRLCRFGDVCQDHDALKNKRNGWFMWGPSTFSWVQSRNPGCKRMKLQNGFLSAQTRLSGRDSSLEWEINRLEYIIPISAELSDNRILNLYMSVFNTSWLIQLFQDDSYHIM